MKLSINELSVGLPGRIYSTSIPLLRAHELKSREINPGPLSTRIRSGYPLMYAISSKSRHTPCRQRRGHRHPRTKPGKIIYDCQHTKLAATSQESDTNPWTIPRLPDGSLIGTRAGGQLSPDLLLKDSFPHDISLRPLVVEHVSSLRKIAWIIGEPYFLCFSANSRILARISLSSLLLGLYCLLERFSSTSLQAFLSLKPKTIHHMHRCLLLRFGL